MGIGGYRGHLLPKRGGLGNSKGGDSEVKQGVLARCRRGGGAVVTVEYRTHAQGGHAQAGRHRVAIVELCCTYCYTVLYVSVDVHAMCIYRISYREKLSTGQGNSSKSGSRSGKVASVVSL